MFRPRRSTSNAVLKNCLVPVLGAFLGGLGLGLGDLSLNLGLEKCLFLRPKKSQNQIFNNILQVAVIQW